MKMMDQMTQSEFNDAIERKNWGDVIRLGEAYIADHGPQYDVTYNVGLAYLQAGDAPMAVAVLLGLDNQETHASIDQRALESALNRTGHSLSDLDVGAHGLKATVIQMSRFSKGYQIHGYAAWMLGFVSCFILIRRFRSRFRDSDLKRFVNVLTLLGATIFGCVSVILIGMIGLSSLYETSWCAVVSRQPIQVFSSSGGDGNVLGTLSVGKPILVFGDTKRPWLDMIDSDGRNGWVDAMNVRCLVEAK